MLIESIFVSALHLSSAMPLVTPADFPAPCRLAAAELDTAVSTEDAENAAHEVLSSCNPVAVAGARSTAIVAIRRAQASEILGSPEASERWDQAAALSGKAWGATRDTAAVLVMAARCRGMRGEDLEGTLSRYASVSEIAAETGDRELALAAELGKGEAYTAAGKADEMLQQLVDVRNSMSEQQIAQVDLLMNHPVTFDEVDNRVGSRLADMVDQAR